MCGWGRRVEVTVCVCGCVTVSGCVWGGGGGGDSELSMCVRAFEHMKAKTFHQTLYRL